ncbi:alkyl sulfatase C-terminal domain-containing protein [Nocardia sp. NPDC055053]
MRHQLRGQSSSKGNERITAIEKTLAEITRRQDNIILAMPVDLLFDYAAVHIDGPAAAEVDLRVNFTVKEPVNEDWTMWVRHGVLNARRRHVDGAQLRLARLGQCTVGAGGPDQKVPG